LPVVPTARGREPPELPQGEGRRPQRGLPPVRHLRALRLRGLPRGLRDLLRVRLPLPRVRPGVQGTSAGDPRPLTSSCPSWGTVDRQRHPMSPYPYDRVAPGRSPLAESPCEPRV